MEGTSATSPSPEDSLSSSLWTYLSTLPLPPRTKALYHKLFHSLSLPPSVIRSLSPPDFRSLGIPLAHRRILSPPPPPMIPFFGHILVHLSNVRTFHSYIATCMQTVIFALALVRLVPEFEAAWVLVGGGLGYLAWGSWRYYAVLNGEAKWGSVLVGGVISMCVTGVTIWNIAEFT